MKKLALLVFSMCSMLFCVAQQNSSIDFVIKNLGVNVDGHFNTFIINTTFDDANNLKSFSGEIQVKSIETGIDNRDEHLLKEDYFHTSNYPLITLQSVALESTSENEYSVTVSLTIKDKTKQLTIPVTVVTSEASRNITSAFEINRRDFGVGGRSLVMGNTVKVNVLYIETL